MGLLENSGQFRKNNLTKNTYTTKKPYSKGNTRALSDGDEFGKGEFNGSVGGKTDINQRKTSMSKNKYSLKKPYGESNV